MKSYLAERLSNSFWSLPEQTQKLCVANAIATAMKFPHACAQQRKMSVHIDDGEVEAGTQKSDEETLV